MMPLDTLTALYDSIHHLTGETMTNPILPDLTSWHRAKPGDVLPARVPYVRETVDSPDASLIYMPHGRRYHSYTIRDSDRIWTRTPLAPPMRPLPTEPGTLIEARGEHLATDSVVLVLCEAPFADDKAEWMLLDRGTYVPDRLIESWRHLWLTDQDPDTAASMVCCAECGTENVGEILCADHREPEVLVRPSVGDPEIQHVAAVLAQYATACTTRDPLPELTIDLMTISKWLQTGALPDDWDEQLALCSLGFGHWACDCDRTGAHIAGGAS